MTPDLVTWLRAQLDEEERVAEAVLARTRRWPKGDRPWEIEATFAASNPGSAGVMSRFQALMPPERVLAEVAAKRRIIEGEQRAARAYPEYADELWRWPASVALAQVYAGRPGWQDEWALPEGWRA